MNNIKNLSKIYIRQILSNYSNILKGKKTSSRNFAGLIFLIIILGYLVFSISMQYLSQMELLEAVNMQDYILFFGMFFANLVLFLIITYEIQGHFFKHKDFELVSSLPITSFQVVVSKFFSILFFTYIYQSVILLPAVVIWFLSGSVTVINSVYLILGYFFIPLFTLLICSSIAFLINLITSKLRYANILNLVMLFIFFLALMVVIYFINTEIVSIFIFQGDIPLPFYFFIPTAIFLFKAVLTGSFLWFGLFLLSSLVCFAITMLILSKFHSRINKNLNNAKSVYKRKKLNFKQKGIMQSLLYLEIKNYFDKNVYIFNTLFGMLILVVASVAGNIIYFNNPEILAGFESQTLYVLILMIFSTLCGLSLTSNTSISFEGKSLYIKKSLPIKISHIFISKILLNVFVILPFFTLGFCCILPIFIALQFHILEILSIFIIPLIMLCSLSTISLMVNLWFPKLNYASETEVVKQSLSVLITTFLGICLIGIFALIYTELLYNFNIYFYIIICTTIIALLGIVFAILLKTKGQKIFRELQ